MSCSARPRFDQYLTSATRSGLSRTIRTVNCRRSVRQCYLAAPMPIPAESIAGQRAIA